LTTPVTISVVSHRQNKLVSGFLGDLSRLCGSRISIIVTQNVPDAVPLALAGFDCPLELIVNQRPRGFGANHNAAFQRCRTPLYCVANPDIRLAADPFPPLVKALDGRGTGVAGPLVRTPAGAIEDSARRFPTAVSLIRKLFAPSAGPDYPVEGGPTDVDWIAGMFMLFDSAVFRAVGGFDEGYFLYYEDVDLCRRLRHSGYKVIYVPGAEVVHDARRGSRRKISLMRHHAASMLRFLLR
jgi:GT2 family glycosyltransferase